jgi:hypothetical protein
MGKTITIRLKKVKTRTYMPIKRAVVFGDKRTKRVRTRGEQVRQAIREYT